MPIKLPTINGAHFLGMSACGDLESEPDILEELFDDSQHELVAALALGGEQMVLALLVGSKASKHVHIDLVKESAYGKRDTKVAVDEIHRRLEPFLGEPIAAKFFGRYRVPLDSLPDGGLINTLRFEVKFDAFSLATTGGELSITGAPIDSLDWKVRGDRVVVDLEGNINTNISDDYLVSIYESLDRAFKGLILAGGNDGM